MNISDETPAYVITVFNPKEVPTTTVVISPGAAKDIIAKAFRQYTVADEYAVRRDAELAVETVQESDTAVVAIQRHEVRLTLTRSLVQDRTTP